MAVKSNWLPAYGFELGGSFVRELLLLLSEGCLAHLRRPLLVELALHLGGLITTRCT